MIKEAWRDELVRLPSHGPVAAGPPGEMVSRSRYSDLAHLVWSPRVCLLKSTLNFLLQWGAAASRLTSVTLLLESPKRPALRSLHLHKCELLSSQAPLTHQILVETTDTLDVGSGTRAVTVASLFSLSREGLRSDCSAHWTGSQFLLASCSPSPTCEFPPPSVLRSQW